MHKATEKEVDFDLNHAKETFMEAKKNFAEASTLGIHEKMPETSVTQEVDPSVLATFLKTSYCAIRN